ncbi:MAG TPA: imidazoleglycerol-phosphate dehydratase HisB [Chloroflexota bacterium]|jgi:imidazoleglycerol-phosphate dehydratase|nr:imidazoleglycerol-phosphate dehydratase HisB [Chloroflexota bacterium]
MAIDPRIGSCTRITGETKANVTWNLDGNGVTQIATGVGFLDHMLDLLCHHGLFDLTVDVQGDLHVDAHHTVEDTGLALGAALREALADRRGIVRMGHAVVPMDEALALVAVDLSGRPYTVLDIPLSGPMLGTLPAEMVTHFFQSLANEARCNLHARVLAGANDHHKVEAVFKGLGRALHAATRRDPARGDRIPSTKGVL